VRLYLLPPSLQDWSPEKHQSRYVVEIVDQFDYLKTPMLLNE